MNDKLQNLKEKLLLQKGLITVFRELDWVNATEEELESYKELLLKQTDDYILDVLDYFLMGKRLSYQVIGLGTSLLVRRNKAIYDRMEVNDNRNEIIENWLADKRFYVYYDIFRGECKAALEK